MSEFLNMGGHGLWIWSSYGVVMLALGGLALQSVLFARRARRDADAMKAARRGARDKT